MRRPKSGLLWAGSGNSTLVENQEGVPGAAEAMPPGRKPQEQLPMAKAASSRWRTHLGDWQRKEVARHKRQTRMEQLTLSQIQNLLVPGSHLFEEEGFRTLMYTEPCGGAGHVS